MRSKAGGLCVRWAWAWSEEGEWENEEKKQEKKENLIKETPFSGDIHFNWFKVLLPLHLVFCCVLAFSVCGEGMAKEAGQNDFHFKIVKFEGLKLESLQSLNLG